MVYHWPTEMRSCLGVGGLREYMANPVLLWELRTRFVDDTAANSDNALKTKVIFSYRKLSDTMQTTVIFSLYTQITL